MVDLHVILAQAVDYATESAIGETDPQLHTFLAFKSNNEMRIYASPPNYGHDQEKGKNDLAAWLRHEFREQGIVAYATISESWMINQDCQAMQTIMAIAMKLPEATRTSFVRFATEALPPPSEHPDRKECVVVSACSATRGVGRTFNIEREGGIIGEGKIVRLTEAASLLDGEIGKDLHGRFITLLADAE